MAVSIVLKGADFSNFITSMSLPDREGLIGEYIFGTDDASSLRNRAGGPALSKIGSPVYGAGYAEIKSSGYTAAGFDTDLKTAEDMTVIAVVKKHTALPPFIWKIENNFFGFINYTSIPSLYNSQSGILSVVADLPGVSSNKFVFYAGQLPKGGYGKIFGADDGALVSATAEVANVSARGTSNNLLIGSSGGNTGAGIAHIAYAAIFERVLSDAEIEAAYQSLSGFLSRRGLDME